MTASENSLLASDDPPPFRVIEGNPSSPYLLTCDHAGKLLPRAVGNLGVSAADLERHIAWDIGAAGVTGALARKLDAFAILQTYSRLVIDCNRPLDSATSIATISETTVIPGNENLAAGEAERRARAIFHPYHERIEGELERRRAAKLASVYVAVHSFTPRFLEVERPWQLGVLYGNDSRFARVLLEGARAEPDLVVGDNQPYFVSANSDYGVIQHAERRGLPYVELEIRQDLIAHESGQREWAERLAHLLERARSELAARP